MQEAIRVERLSKSYGNLLAIRDINLSVKRGTAYGLLGPNGAGKSTTLECILGAKDADRGTVTILDCNPQKDRKRLFQKVGVQFQECDYQPEIKVSELCEETSCLYAAPADWIDLCNRFGIGEKIASAVKNLSGGERQRLFVVLALIPNPQLVFLDELTTGLDAKARRDVWRELARLKERGITIFLTSHFMDEVEALCDEICILKKGEAVFYGTVEQAKKQSGRFLLFRVRRLRNNENFCRTPEKRMEAKHSKHEYGYIFPYYAINCFVCSRQDLRYKARH